MKLSIIIPMYNVEKYIGACLDSIQNSDLPKEEYEVIIVNDGSKDNSPTIAQEYCTKHNNFRYLTQENQGQSVARNYGIKEAQGEYLWFVDSDDKIDKEIDQILIKIEELNNPDIISFYLRYVTEDNQFLSKAFPFPGEYNKLMTGRDAVLAGYMPSSVCVFFLKRSFVNDNKLSFYPGIYHQDSEFSYRMMAHAQSVYFTEYVPYIYIRHENTVVTATSIGKIKKKQLDDITIVKSFKKLSEEFRTSDSELSKVISLHCDNMVFGIVYSSFKNRKEWKPNGINSAVIAQLKEEGLYPIKGPFGSWKKWIMSKLLNIEWLLK